MELSIFLAKVFGLLLLLMSFAVLLDIRHYEKVLKEFAGSPLSIFLHGSLALIIGLAMVTYHNIWEWSWVGLITFFGWAALLKGSVRLLFPKFCMKSLKTWFGKKNFFLIMAVLSMALGAYLSYYGFFA